jgi:hypothetical protein
MCSHVQNISQQRNTQVLHETQSVIDYSLDKKKKQREQRAAFKLLDKLLFYVENLVIYPILRFSEQGHLLTSGIGVNDKTGSGVRFNLYIYRLGSPWIYAADKLFADI